MTPSGSSAPKMAVPATMTLLPWARKWVCQIPLAPGFHTHQHTSVSAYTDRLGSNTAVDLDIFVWEPRTQLGHLGHTSVQEFLAALT